MRNNGFLSLCALFLQYYLVLILIGCIGVEGRYLRLPLGYDNDNSVITIVTCVLLYCQSIFKYFFLLDATLFDKQGQYYYLPTPHFLS